MIPANASRNPARRVVDAGGVCWPAAIPCAGRPEEASAGNAGSRDAGTAGEADDDGVVAASTGCSALASGVWSPGAVGTTSTVVVPGPGGPETAPPGAGAAVGVSVGEGAAVGDTVGDGAGVVGRGIKGVSGTQTPPPPTGTWPAGHGSAAAVAAIVSTLTTTADHSARMPKTFRRVPTPYNATQQTQETRGPSAVAS
jgi:hypothetical protein